MNPFRILLVIGFLGLLLICVWAAIWGYRRLNHKKHKALLILWCLVLYVSNSFLLYLLFNSLFTL